MKKAFTRSSPALLLLAAVWVSTTIAAAAPGVAQGGITVEDPDGGPPGEHFTDLTMVPGDKNTSTLIVSQSTGDSAEVGVRFEAETARNALHEQAQLTVEGPGETVSAPLGDMLDSESPIWLGTLRSDEEADLRFAVHLPAQAGNDTKRTQAGFRVIVTARADLPDDTPPPESPEPSPSGPDDPHDPSPSPDPTGSPDPNPSETPSPDSNPDEDLPRTGTDIFLLVLVAAVFVGIGTLAVRVARQRI